MSVKNESPLKLHKTFWFVMLNNLVSSYTSYILPLFMSSDFTCKKVHLLACFILLSACIIWGTFKVNINCHCNRFIFHVTYSWVKQSLKWGRTFIHWLDYKKSYMPEWRQTALCYKSYLTIIALSNSLYSCFRGRAVYLHYDERLQR